MADPIIRLKRSAVAGKRPTLANLPLGEVALNTYDGRLFVRQDTGGVGIATTIRTVNPWSENYQSGGEHSIYYDSGDVGIGTQIPTSTLDVNGTVTATSFVGNGSSITGITFDQLSDVTFTNVGQHDIAVYHDGEGWLNDPGASRVVQEVRNVTGIAITQAYPVYETGYNQGNERVTIDVANAGIPTAMPALGIIHDADLGSNSNGYVIISGIADGIDTSGYSEGDELYVAVGGGLTNTRPAGATDLIQKIGTVLRSHATTGSILIQGAGRTNDVPNTISVSSSITAGDGFYGDGSGITGLTHSQVSGAMGDVVDDTTPQLGGNLDLNSNDITGTGNINITGSGTFSGNVSIAGTLTYEDVTNVDSVGLITARTGIDVLSGDITLKNGSEENSIRTNSSGQFQILRDSSIVALTIDDNSGRVGIATDNPGLFALDVRGTGQVARFGDPNLSNDALWIDITNDGYPALRNPSSNDNLTLRSSGSVEISIDDNNFNTSKTFTVVSNGNSGSGTELFKINESGETTITASSTSALFIKDNSVDSSGLKLYSDSAGLSHINAGYGNLVLETSGTERFRIDSAGNVGIGTDAPGYKLEVNGDIKVGELGTLWFSDTSGSIEKIESTASSLDLYADSTISFYESDASAVKFTINTNAATAYFSADSDTYWYRPAANTHAWTTNGVERFRINTTGVDVTGNITVTGTVDGRDVAADGTKLDGIESGATADQTAAEILTLIKTVDGTGSGLDADLLDGQEGSYYQNASNINAGTLNDARLSYTELDRSPVGNFGQWSNHSAYNNFNTPPAYWGWTYLNGTTNAPNTSSGQWYRGRFSLGNAYGLGSDAGDYWMEMAIPRYSQGGAPGNLWIRTCENGVEQTWRQVAATISGNTTWHAGNDGSGSGLDADTVDGIQGASFLRSDANDSATGLYSFSAGAYSANVTYGGRSIQTQIDINSTSMRGGVLVRNANDFRSETDSASFMHYDAYNTSATSYAFRASKGTTLADTFWVKGDGTAYFADDVGIGNNNPGAKLDVFGTARIGGTVSSSRRADFDTNGRLTLAYGDNSNTSNLILANLATDATTNHGSNIAWDFGTNTSASPITAARIDVVKEQQWTSTATTQDAKFAIVLAENGVLGEKFSINSNGNVTLTGNVFLGDSDVLNFGDSNDLQIFHNGSYSLVGDFGDGNLILAGNTSIDLMNPGASEYYARFINNGAVELYFDNAKKFETTSTGVDVTGNITLTGDLDLDDNKKILLGTGNDCEIYHNGSANIIQSTNGSISLQVPAGSEIQLAQGGSFEHGVKFIAGGAVQLYHNNSLKLATSSTGVDVTGLLSATTKSFVIDHPTKEGMKLRHGSLEGPENGVYIRGRLKDNNTIELPDYWTGLVDEETITVNLTPIGRKAPLHSVVDIADNTVVVESANDIVDCFYTVFGERKDVERFEVEF